MLIIIVVVVLILWSGTFFGYHDTYTEPLDTDESKCFSPKCESIVKIHENKSDTAIFMIHGFASTPHTYTYASERLFDEGYDCFAPLMPGFGTDPKDLIKTSYTQWFDYICRKYEEVRKNYTHVYVIGVSMGGFMTINLAEKYSGTPLDPDGIVTVDAPIVYNSFFRDHIITHLSGYFSRLLNIFMKSAHTNISLGYDDGSNDGDGDWVGYKGLFVGPGMSLLGHEKAVRNNLKDIDVPMFSMHAVGDKTVPFANFPIIAAENGSPDFKGRVVKMQTEAEHSHHVLLIYHSVRVTLMDDIIQFFKEKNNDDKTI